MENSRSGKDEVARFQSGTLTQKRDDLFDAKYLVFSGAVLHSLSIELGPDVEVLAVFDDVLGHDTGPVRRPSIEALAKRPLASAEFDLPVTVRYIVANSITQDIIQCIIFGNVKGLLANDDDKLAFVIQ